MVAADLPEPRSDHAQAAIEMAMAMQRYLETMRAERPELRLRVGIHTGPVVAGVIGENKFTYELGRQCEHCQSDGIPWTAGAHSGDGTLGAGGGEWEFEDRGLIEVKGQGPMRTFLLKSNDSTGRRTNL
jgi:hypothetical protein